LEGDDSDWSGSLVVIGLAGIALLLSTSPQPGAGQPSRRTTVQVIQTEQRTIIRVPLGRSRQPAPMSVWRERRSGRCIDSTRVAGAAITPDGAVDFVLRGGKRLRAWLESECPALDFYQGFYVKPDQDGLVCAGRDAIHSRSGGECQIDRFRRLEPVTGMTPR
jgi:hypothetical protein